MSIFRGILYYEFLMQLRRKALWIALAVPYALLTVPDILRVRWREDLQSIGTALVFYAQPLQIFVPIVAGFFLSDRLYRDAQLGTEDWVAISHASKRSYIWGKYLGAVTATLLASFTFWVGGILIEAAFGVVPAATVIYAAIAFFLMAIPAYLFIGAYCVAVPRVMSLRLYQILFSCYWLWAYQQRVPSVAGTPLAPGGEIALLTWTKALGTEFNRNILYGPFGLRFEVSLSLAVLNVTLLLGLALGALVVLERYLIWKEARR